MSSPSQPVVSLIIPAYREAGRLPRTLPDILAFLDEHDLRWEVRIVDDGSGDATLQVARGFADADPRVLVQAEPHRGKGGAVRAGMLAASAPYRVMCDADMSMPVQMVPRLLTELARGADVAIASREAPGARRIDEPPHRHFMGRIFNSVVRVLAVHGIQDTQCGFKAFTAATAQRLFRASHLDGFAFDVEVLFLAQRLGMEIVEVPIDWTHDPDTRVSPGRDTRRMLAEIAKIRVNRRMGRYDGI
jgi:dolichyl-phosphate beta-glucosyltransferase